MTIGDFPLIKLRTLMLSKKFQSWIFVRCILWAPTVNVSGVLMSEVLTSHLLFRHLPQHSIRWRNNNAVIMASSLIVTRRWYALRDHFIWRLFVSFTAQWNMSNDLFIVWLICLLLSPSVPQKLPQCTHLSSPFRTQSYDVLAMKTCFTLALDSLTEMRYSFHFPSSFNCLSSLCFFISFQKTQNDTKKSVYGTIKNSFGAFISLSSVSINSINITRVLLFVNFSWWIGFGGETWNKRGDRFYGPFSNVYKKKIWRNNNESDKLNRLHKHVIFHLLSLSYKLK